MKIGVLCLLFNGLLVNGATSEHVRTNNPWKEDTQEELMAAREDFLNAANSLYPDKESSSTLEEFPEEIKRNSNRDTEMHTRLSARAMSPHLFLQTVCSCDTQYKVTDLGEGSYPRYLTESRCKPKPCLNKINSCILLNYNVHVLRQRDTVMADEHYIDDSVLPEWPLPESLRHKWQLKPMSIPVACIPSTEGRRY